MATSLKAEARQPLGCGAAQRKLHTQQPSRALLQRVLSQDSLGQGGQGDCHTVETGSPASLPARLGQMVAFSAEPKLLTQNGHTCLWKASEGHPSRALD